jgi:hypothetical protein
MRDKHYKSIGMRLDDENIKWLRQERKKHKSWNLLVKELIKKYDVPVQKMPKQLLEA